MVVAIAPIVPVLAALGAVGLIGGYLYFTSREDGELGPAPQPGQLPPAPNPNDPNDAEPIPGKPDDEPPPPAQAVVDGLVGTYEDAAFHEAQSGDSINRLVTKTLNGISPGKGNVPAMIGALRRLLNRSQWNRDLYGEPMPNDNYAHNGVAVNRVYLPKHEDAVGIMRTGFFPKRNIDAQGKRNGSAVKWGDLWVPALNHTAVEQGVSDPNIMLAPPWPDGTPATEPPPELFEALRLREVS